MSTGGSVSNTGLALKKLGMDVTLMGKVGDDDFGKTVINIFESYGASGLLVDKNETTSYSIVIAIPGTDRIFLHDPGANNSFCVSDIPESELEKADYFHFGYPPLMKSMYENDGLELINLFKLAKSKNLITSLDFATISSDSEAGKIDWISILNELLPYVDFFVPSFEELCFMLDKQKYERLSVDGGDMTEKLDICADVKPLADKLITMGAKHVLIKCGVSGLYYKDNDEEIIQPCYKPNVVLSGTGAGDTSIAAFLASMSIGRSMKECVRNAAAEGACCVEAYDALSGIKTIEEIEKKIDQGWEVLK